MRKKKAGDLTINRICSDMKDYDHISLVRILEHDSCRRWELFSYAYLCFTVVK